MIAQETIKQIQDISIEERIHFIEILLSSLKKDIKDTRQKQHHKKKFTVSTFDLGQDIHANRDNIYSERGLL